LPITVVKQTTYKNTVYFLAVQRHWVKCSTVECSRSDTEASLDLQNLAQ